MSFSIIVPSCGRPTLSQTLASIAPQLVPGDEILVDVNADGDWGGASRNRMIAKATGSHLLFMDDDDVFVPDAFQIVRAALSQTPDAVHIFRMRYSDGRELWDEPVLRMANVSTQMFCVPNSDQVGAWTPIYPGDWDFIRSTCEKLGEPIWHSEVIALLRPQTLGSYDEPVGLR